MIIIGKNLEFWRNFFFTLENISNFRGILSELGKIFGILLLNLNFVFFSGNLRSVFCGSDVHFKN